MAMASEQNGERAEAAGLYHAAADMAEPKFGIEDHPALIHLRAKARKLSA
eukprot:CAMPEP_0119538662 /NCGR_PEP_ID=MMETSP1344-20130328/51036_1 /TAXON_ID=236787 /ORGANISM="Florenciella parvula, Strain CCMP2471" /LENGTH=49 /DNA_ID=CAMNT_0007581651 /DNA_START=165 /DNA_END=314 /DNA_ORIENTATION=-